MKVIGKIIGVLICAFGSIFLLSGFLQGCFGDWPGRYDNPGGGALFIGIVILGAGAWIYNNSK